MAWIKVVLLGLFAKVPCKIAALVVVPFLSDLDRVTHPVFGVRDATDLSWANVAWRNGCHNMLTIPQPEFWTKGNTDDQMENPGFKKRYRISKDGRYVSLRITWGKYQGRKGKKEFYIGWTMNDEPYARLTFFQFTPFRGMFS